MRRAALALVLLALAAGDAAAADGPRVRVSILRKASRDSLPASLAPGQSVKGALLAARPLTLALERTNGDTLALPRSAIRRFEIADGRRTHVGRGAQVGVVTGLLLGGLLGAVFEPIVNADGEAILKGAAAGGIVGLGLGGLIGLLIPGDRWKATAPPPPSD